MLVLVIGAPCGSWLKSRNSTSTIHLDGHPHHTGNADEITPRARTLTAIIGLGLSERGFPPTSDELADAMRPFADVCIDAFGSNRAMFESNFPVDKASFSYSVFWNACKKITLSMSEGEKNDLFCRTAARCYRLDSTCEPDLLAVLG